jgi:UDP-N-acetyl-2-amino-2-deoxyglucuronate dehydrogenase
MTNTSLTPLRYAIIGCGGVIAPTHIQALTQLPDAQIVAMSDLDEARGAPRAAEVGSKFYVDYKTMLAETRPDVAVICVPHPFHAPIAVDCFAAGTHVLVEKPIAVEIAAADQMIEAAEQAQKLLVTSFQYRYRPEAQKARQLIDNGELGEIQRVHCVEPWYRPAAYYASAGWRGTWRGEGGGVLMNQGPHGLDLLCYLAGSPSRVWGWTRTRAHAITVEDTAQAMLEFPNGAPGYIYFSTVEAGSPRTLQIIGDKAAIEIQGPKLTIQRFSESLSSFRQSSTNMFSAPSSETETFDFSQEGTGHLAVYEDLQNAIRTGGQPLAHGREASKSLELANAIVLSSNLNQAVDLPMDRSAYSALLAELREREA